jgi:mRNA interferase MazF
MDRLHFGDIVLLKFPFTNNKTFKKRPTFVLHDFQDDDVLFCRITSKDYSTKFDVAIKNWDDIGRMLPSVIRAHKMATLNTSLINVTIGSVDEEIKSSVYSIFNSILVLK